MSPETLRRRLEVGKCNNFQYAKGEQEGLVSVWRHQEAFILTCEECPAGGQYDESPYTRDERYVLASVDEVFRYLADNGLGVGEFRP